MVFAAFGLLLSALAWIKGHFKSWKKYYASVLFVIIGNESCDLLLLKKPLWDYTDFFGEYMLARIVLMFILYSGTVILYLARFPKKKRSAVPYIAFWTILYTVIEYFSMLLGLFSHLNGWTIYYTAIHNLAMFLLIYLHDKKPLPAWILSFASSITVMLLFKTPFVS
jgi:hypothetical protein